MSKADELLAEIDAAVERLNKAKARLKAMENYKVREGLGYVYSGEITGLLHDDADEAAERVAWAMREYRKERMK
jgi:hypothetical protein